MSCEDVRQSSHFLLSFLPINIDNMRVDVWNLFGWCYCLLELHKQIPSEDNDVPPGRKSSHINIRASILTPFVVLRKVRLISQEDVLTLLPGPYGNHVSLVNYLQIWKKPHTSKKRAIPRCRHSCREFPPKTHTGKPQLIVMQIAQINHFTVVGQLPYLGRRGSHYDVYSFVSSHAEVNYSGTCLSQWIVITCGEMTMGKNIYS